MNNLVVKTIIGVLLVLEISACEEGAPKNSTGEPPFQKAANNQNEGMISHDSMSDPSFSQGLYSEENINESGELDFLDPTATPLSTFSIDVDTASYSLMRSRFKDEIMPHATTVRVEEF